MKLFQITGLSRRALLLLSIIPVLAASEARAALAFNFIADPGTPQQVMDGFTQAGNRWSAVLQNDITVTVNVGFLSLPGGVIGQTTGEFQQFNYADVVSALNASATSADDFSAYASLQTGDEYSRLINHTSDNPNGPNSATVYQDSLAPMTVTRANAKALGLLMDGAGSDGSLRFNSDVGFDFSPSDGTTSGQFDFVTVATHELGHLLGFLSVVDSIEAEQGNAMAGELPSTVMDLFRFSANSYALGQGVIDSSADGRSKYFSVDGGATSVRGLASGAVYGTGYQASHWREFTFAGLMDPTIFPGLQRAISANDQRLFDVIGYQIPEPEVALLLLVGLAGLLCRFAFQRL